MSTPSAARLLRAYYAALDTYDLDALDTLLDPTCDWKFPGTALVGPAAVRGRMENSRSLGLTMDHRIGHMVDGGDVAICELVATNTLPEATFTVSGAVVCEARDGRIARLAAYPDAKALTAFLGGMADRARQLRATSATT